MLDFLEKRKSLFIYLPLTVYWIILLLLTSLPGEDLPKSISFNDKLEHLSSFFILSVLLTLAFKAQNRFLNLKKRYLLSALIATSVYGALDELHQLFIPGRSCDFFDWTADTTGALIGICFMALVIFIDRRNLAKQTALKLM